jgi:hypothetical protein
VRSNTFSDIERQGNKPLASSEAIQAIQANQRYCFALALMLFIARDRSKQLRLAALSAAKRSNTFYLLPFYITFGYIERQEIWLYREARSNPSKK